MHTLSLIQVNKQRRLWENWLIAYTTLINEAKHKSYAPIQLVITLLIYNNHMYYSHQQYEQTPITAHTAHQLFKVNTIYINNHTNTIYITHNQTTASEGHFYSI